MKKNMHSKSIHTTRQLAAASLITALTAAGAFIRIPFPLAPITLQTLFTLLAGAVLLPRYALLSQVVYIVIGLLGLPVFANGGGPAYILQPTFGYLAGLPLAAWLIALLYQRNHKQSFIMRLLFNYTGACLLLMTGVAWMFLHFRLVLHSPVSMQTLLTGGLLIFVPGELLKAAFTAWLSPLLRKQL